MENKVKKDIKTKQKPIHETKLCMHQKSGSNLFTYMLYM